MRRALVAPPLVCIVATSPACAAPPLRPSTSAADWIQPTHLAAVLPARDGVLRAWMLPATNPWASYAKYTLLTSLGEAPVPADLPDVDALADVQQARAAGARVATAGLPAGVLWVIDLRGAGSVAFGHALAAGSPGGSVSLVPTFNNWPADDEIIPAEEALAAMVSALPAGQAEAAAGAQPVFLLDAWRMAYRDDDLDDEVYDNRYMLSAGDFPDAETLRAHGVRRVAYLVYDLRDASVEEDDLNAVFAEWEAEGIDVAMIDLASLGEPLDPTQWDELFATRSLAVAPRATVLDDPAFYLRARGGFGGIFARPFRLGGGFGGWRGFGGWHGGRGASG